MTGYTQQDIQRIIKETVSKSFIFEFLNESINEENIQKFGKLLDISEVSNKYLFDLIIALLYKEVISIDAIIESIQTAVSADELEEGTPNFNSLIKVLEKAVALEYNLYEIIGGFTATSANSNAIKYVRKYIPKLYYGLADRISYKNEANITSELTKLYNLTDIDFD
jgi:hypothetical protein